MAYGGNYGNRGNYGGNNGGYQRNNYGGNQGGGYQQQAQTSQPVDIPTEIARRFELLKQFEDVAINQFQYTKDEFLMMSPMLGGWVTSILLTEDKQKGR